MDKIGKDKDGKSIYLDENGDYKIRKVKCIECGHEFKTWHVSVWCPVCGPEDDE